MSSVDSFLPGQYSYPFSFKLPAELPGTYVHKGGFLSGIKKCSCTYYLYCELLNGHSMIGRSSCPIVIMQQARIRCRYDIPDKIQGPVTTWCCCHMGIVSIKSVLEKNVIRMNETVSMRLNADLTHCKVDVRSLTIYLKRNLFLRTSSGKSKSKKDRIM